MSHLWLYELVWVIQGSVFAYFLSLNAVYALVLILSVSWCRNYKKKSLAHPIDLAALPGLENLVPPVTVIVPAYNEEKVIVQNVRSLLSISYARIEVIVVNDGSADRTLDELMRSFSLHRALVRPSGWLRISSRVWYSPMLRTSSRRGPSLM